MPTSPRFRSERLAFAACIVAGLCLACDRAPRPNVVMITIDTTRADHLGCYGYDRPTSPNIDALARESVLFENGFAHVPITLPSHTSIFTGTLPLFHGVRDNGRYVVRKELETLAELLSDRGYATGAFVSAFVLDSRYGLDQGFDTYDDNLTAEWSEDDLRDARIYNQMITDRNADQTTEQALAWLAEHGGDPFFMWVHYYDPHHHWDPPRPYNQRFQDSLYDGEIAFMDSQIGRLLDGLRERGLWDDSLVVLTSDHGEGLGQHGEPTHAVLTYDATLRVALMFKPPAAAGIGPGISEDRVSHVDVMPTITELLGVPTPEDVQGHSLLGRLRGATARERPSYFECNLPRFGFGWEPIFGIRSEGWKYIHAPRPQLYHLAEDPDELYDLAESESLKRQDLESLLFAMVESESAPPELVDTAGGLDAEAQRKLAALGYLGSGSTASAAELNPRQPTGRRSPFDGITYLNEYYLATSLAARGQLEEAAALYETILLPLDPENPTFLINLGDLKRKLGDQEGAYAMFRLALEADPGSASTLVDLGQLEADRGRPEAAEELYLAARQLAPGDLRAAYFSARLAANQGRYTEAVERYRQALEIDPSHASSLINLGVQLARLERFDEARQQLRQALKLEPFSARGHYNFGLLELRTGSAETAIPSLELALRLRPAYPDARLALGMAALEAGDEERGRQELDGLVRDMPQSRAAQRARQALTSLDLDPGKTAPEDGQRESDGS